MSDPLQRIFKDLNAEVVGWERSFVDRRRVRCAGCGSEYDSVEGLTIVASPVSGDVRRIVLDEPDCARSLQLEAVAKVMDESRAAGLAPLTCDSEGRTLPHWRIAEIRDGAVWEAGQEPWRDEDAAPEVLLYDTNPMRDRAQRLDEAIREDVGVASDDEIAEFLAEDGG